MTEEFSFKATYSSLFKIYLVGSIFLVTYFTFGICAFKILEPYSPDIQKVIHVKEKMLMRILALPIMLGILLIFILSIKKYVASQEKKIDCRVSKDEIICRFDKHELVLRKENLRKSVLTVSPTAPEVWTILIKSKNNPSFIFFGNNNENAFQKFINSYIDMSGIDRKELYAVESGPKNNARKTFYHNK